LLPSIISTVTYGLGVRESREQEEEKEDADYEDSRDYADSKTKTTVLAFDLCS
jgi:hypothetical protein